MKNIFILTAALLLMTAMTGEAMADCATNQVKNIASGANNLTALLETNTVCQAPGADETHGAQEQHRIGGQLWDYKKGSADPVDPTAQIGNWTVTGTDTNTEVNYTYFGGGGSGSYKVYDNTGNYDFCNGTTRIATVTILTGVTSCP